MLRPVVVPSIVKLATTPSGAGDTVYAARVAPLDVDNPRVRAPPGETVPPPVRGAAVLMVKLWLTDEGTG